MKASERQKTSQPDLLLLLPPVIPTSPFLKQPDKQKPTIWPSDAGDHDGRIAHAGRATVKPLPLIGVSATISSETWQSASRREDARYRNVEPIANLKIGRAADKLSTENSERTRRELGRSPVQG